MLNKRNESKLILSDTFPECLSSQISILTLDRVVKNILWKEGFTILSKHVEFPFLFNSMNLQAASPRLRSRAGQKHHKIVEK